MINSPSFRVLLLACAVPLMAGGAEAQSIKKSPQKVMHALATFPRVVLHTQILIDAKNYARLPHENQEVKEGAEALHTSLSAETAGFKAKVDPLIETAVADSQTLADTAVSGDLGKINAAHDKLAVSVKALMAAFPASVQPPPPKPPKG
jgi:hypothetical protein